MTTEPFAAMLGITKLTTANFKEPSGQRFFTSHWVGRSVPPIDACAKFRISPCTKGREMETGRFVWPKPDPSVIVTSSPTGGGGGVVDCETLTVTLLEVAVLPDLSVAFAARMWEPLLTVVVSHNTA